MKKLNKLTGFGAVLLMSISAGTVYAEESDTTQTRSQDRVRTQLNLQVPTSDFGQPLNREQHTVRNQNQNQYQYKYMNKHQNKESNKGSTSSMNHMNTTNRHMQGSTASGSMNRVNTASRSMTGGRGRR